MATHSLNTGHNAYRSTGNYSRVSASDPHGLILMLLDGAVERIARARGCIENQDYAGKAQLLHRAVAIIDELRVSLDMSKGGSLAENLHGLYEYMCRQILNATVDNNVRTLDEVLGLLHQIRDGWSKIPQPQRAVHAP